MYLYCSAHDLDVSCTRAGKILKEKSIFFFSVGISLREQFIGETAMDLLT